MTFSGIKWWLLSFCCLTVLSQATSQTVVINEFMASNFSVIADEDGDYEDWIELYNTGNETVNLESFGISDDWQEPFLWVFPSVEIQPGEYLLVWASGKDRAEPGQSLHTNFSIKSDGEYLMLSAPDGEILDFVSPVYVPTNISYGRQGDGENSWYFFTEATPGTTNITQGFESVLNPPQFSHPGGFYHEEFHLTISASQPESTIYYTLDGSEPDPENLQGTSYQYKNSYPQNPNSPPGNFLTGSFVSNTYEVPIPISNRSSAPDRLTQKSSTFHEVPYYFPANPVFKGTVVRAMEVKAGSIPSEVSTNVYFVHPQGREKYSLPVISISTSPDNLFDYTAGIYNAGEDFDNWKLANPSASGFGGSPANYRRRGIEWEYPARFCYFDADSSFAGLSQEIGFRIHGGYSRQHHAKSLRLYARNRYSESEFAYPFFPDVADESFRRLILRNSGNDRSRTLFRDALIQKVVGELNFETQAYRPAILFINAEYWGIHNIRERYDRQYLERRFGVDPDNIDLLEHNAVVKEGDNHHYLETLQFIEENDITVDANFAWVQTRIDTDNFIDYQIANIYSGNTDWPGNNVEFWRHRTGAYIPEAPYGLDGRWRWLAFDMDFGFGLNPSSPGHNTLAFAIEAGNEGYPNPDWATFLLRNLLDNESFRLQFINRFADLLNSHFLPERVISLLNEYKENLSPEIGDHIYRWKNPSSLNVWTSHVNHMRNFVNNRPVNQRAHIRNVFGLHSNTSLTLDVSDPEHGYIRINSIDILPSTPGIAGYPWQGIYFRGVPVEITAIPFAGYQFSHWEGTDANYGNIFTADPYELDELTAHFIPTNESPHPPPIAENPLSLQKSIENGLPVSLNLHDVFTHPDGLPMTFTASIQRPDFVDFTLEESILTLFPLRRGDTKITVFANDGVNSSVSTDFRVLIYPEAVDVATPGGYTFDFWSAEQQELSYPENMLFLQSDTTDPGLETPLLHPYFIPYLEYHDDDLGNVGLPYQNTRRTRINGLGSRGISFINTGRDRDLGGVLLAINTMHAENLGIRWLAGTELQNDRHYAIRLQYRVGKEGPFQDIAQEGVPMKYRAQTDGHEQTLTTGILPPEILNQEYVQLLWRYHHVEGDSGPRSCLRLADIEVSLATSTWELKEEDPPLIFARDNELVVKTRYRGRASLGVYNMMGQQFFSSEIQQPGTHTFPMALPGGVYIVYLYGEEFGFSGKVIFR